MKSVVLHGFSLHGNCITLIVIMDITGKCEHCVHVEWVCAANALQNKLVASTTVVTSLQKILG